ncbi:hypothetical protein [Aliikangiella sp. IMCC44359]|uniref:hypothetical protein n=1 Tax=Aliikangiella sp. IMCC44359 TaxID=3459125 RepID=UPI00403AEBD1
MLAKAIKILIIIAFLTYILFLWKVNSALKNFVQLRPANITIDYAWFWVDWKGTLYLNDVLFINKNNATIASSDQTQVIFPGVTSLLDLDDWLTYQEFPKNLTVHIKKAITTNNFALFANSNIAHPTKQLDFFPTECEKILTEPPAPFPFELTTQFEFFPNTSKLVIQSYLNTIGFIDAEVTSEFDNFAEDLFADAFLGALHIQAKDLTWLQESIATCTKTLAKKEQPAKLFSGQLKQFTEKYHYSLSEELLEKYSHFILSPQSFELIYSPKTGYTWSQLMNIPANQLPKKIGLKTKLNQHQVNSFFKDFDLTQAIRNKTKTQNNLSFDRSFLPISYYGINNYIGAEVILHLKGKASIHGRVERVDSKRLFLSQYHFSGRSTIPYKLREIASIELSNNNHIKK